MAEEKDKEQQKKPSEPSELSTSEDSKPEISQPDEDVFPTEEFEHLPPEAKKHVSRMISMFMSSGPAPHPLFSKMNTEQVGKIIQNVENESVREHEDRMSSRRWNFAALVIVLIFILLLAAGCLWKDKLEYIAPIITALIGGVGGYGIGVSRNGKRG